MKPKKRQQLERAEGRALMLLVGGRWWAPMLHHSPNEEMHPIARQIAAGQGTRPGFPDYILPMRTAHYVGLVVELKAPRPWGAAPAGTQRAWLDWFASQGWRAEVCFGAEQAIAVLDDYTAGARRPEPPAPAWCPGPPPPLGLPSL